MADGYAQNDLTATLLQSRSEGRLSRSAADRIFSAAYDELKLMAQREMRKEAVHHTLQSSALLNEVYLKLCDQSRIEWDERAHFFGIAIRAMRQVLIDHARRRGADKRGGGWARVSLHENTGLAEDDEVEAQELERVLAKLSQQSDGWPGL